MRELKTVDDVLRWAFDHFRIEGLCGGDCVCDGNDTRHCSWFRDCNLGKSTACDVHECDKSCWTSGAADHCYAETIVLAPERPRWTSEPLSGPGLYWLFVREKLVIAEVGDLEAPDSKDWRVNVRLGRDEFDFLGPMWVLCEKEKNLQWLKIEEPEIPTVSE